MRKKNVMTVESFDSPISQQMLHNLYQNDAFAEFNVSHCFIGGAKDADELYERLSSHIQAHNVSVMLIHTGSEFSRLADFFPRVLQRLFSQFKNFKIGLQRRKEQNQEIIKYTTKSKTIIELEKRFFYNSR